MSKTIETKGYVVSFADDKKTRDEIFRRVINFYVAHDAFDGESIMQSDKPQEDAAPFLSDLADDILHFDVKWKDEG